MNTKNVTDLQDMIEDLTMTVKQSEDKIHFYELLDIVGGRAYAALLVLPALLAASPLTAIPGISFFFALLIVFVASQMLLRRQSMWLPVKLSRMEFKKQKTLKALHYMEGPARLLDKVMRPRLQFLTGSFGESFVLFLSLLLAIASIPAMVIPLANLVLCIAILFFAMGLLAKDGIVILIGMGFAIAPIYGALSFFVP